MGPVVVSLPQPWPAYCLSKAALNAATRILGTSTHTRAQGLAVTAVCPGDVLTGARSRDVWQGSGGLSVDARRGGGGQQVPPRGRFSVIRVLPLTGGSHACYPCQQTCATCRWPRGPPRPDCSAPPRRPGTCYGSLRTRSCARAGTSTANDSAFRGDNQAVRQPWAGKGLPISPEVWL